MSKCLPWSSNHRHRQNQHTYIYLYTPEMSNSSRLSRCLISLIFVFCLILIIILTGATIYYVQNHRSIRGSHSNQYEVALAKKRQLPFFVNLNIDPCENFVEFVCDKWIMFKSSSTFEQKTQRIQTYLHDQLMNNDSSVIQQFYQLCENQSPILLIDEFEQYIANLIQHEPYSSYLTIYNQTKTNHSNQTFYFPQESNPFWSIHSSNQTINLTRIYPRSFLSPVDIFLNNQSLNQTALKHLVHFNSKYHKFFSRLNQTLPSYEHEYHQDSLLIKRILTYSNYHQCLPTLNKSNGLENLIDLLNYFLQSRLNQFNTKLIDKQIRILPKLTDNHTLIEHLQRIRREFHLIDHLVIDQMNTTCIIHLLDRLLDERFRLNEISSNLNFYLQDNSDQYLFVSNDWPYLVMLTEHLLKDLHSETLINFVFFHFYRQLIYPYYQPHIQSLSNSNSIQSCFDILNSSHPSLLNQIIDENHRIPVSSIRTIVETVLERFRFLIDRSDNLFSNEKNLLLNHLKQIQIHLIHFASSVVPTTIDFNSTTTTTYLDYVRYLSSIPSDESIRSYSIEPIYFSNNQTLFLPYGYLFLSNPTIEYSLTHFLLKILSNLLQSNPFYIECLIKSIEHSNNTSSMDTIDEHIVYLLFRSKYLDDKQINLDEYLWPFMSANFQMKQFLINYTADYYCLSNEATKLFRNNTYLIDDVHLVFNCPQASSIKQSKCTVN